MQPKTFDRSCRIVTKCWQTRDPAHIAWDEIASAARIRGLDSADDITIAGHDVEVIYHSGTPTADTVGDRDVIRQG